MTIAHDNMQLSNFRSLPCVFFSTSPYIGNTGSRKTYFTLSIFVSICIIII